MLKSTYNLENVSVQYLRVYCTLTLHYVIECTPKRPELSVQYRTHHLKLVNKGGGVSSDRAEF